MHKTKLTLSVDDEIIEIAKKNNLNISKFLENSLAKKFGLKRTNSLWVKVDKDE